MNKLKSQILKENHNKAVKLKCSFLNDDLFIAMGQTINIKTDFTRINALYDFFSKNKEEDIRIINPNIVYSNNNVEIIDDFEDLYYHES